MRKIFFYCLIILYSSCTLKEQEQLNKPLYFDLADYFKSEAKRLGTANLPIYKSVVVNGETESKKTDILNWEKEFESFISADINKASWRGFFNVKKTDSLALYVTANKKIPIKSVEITYQNNKVYSIIVLINNSNVLYTSQDSLSYFPDSLYHIKKMQQIKLMDEKVYQVIGRFK